MRKTGNDIFGMQTGPVTAGMRAGLKSCCALAALTFLFTLAAPLTIDLSGNSLSWNFAHAGNGDGNYGNGKGNGGANGQNPGNSGQNNGGSGGSGDSGQDGGTGSNPVLHNDPGQEGTADEAADMADDDFSESVASVGGPVAEGPFAGPAAMGLPTISQLFSLGDEATVSAEEELRLISNGWNSN